MKKEVISERQGIILIILFLIGSTFLIGTGGQAKQDSWLSMIISIIFGVFLVLMFSRMMSLYPGKDLFDILELTMGKFVGKTISIVMIWYAFHLGSLVMRNVSEFTNANVLGDTPVIVPMILLTILLIWGVKEGIEVLGRWSEFFIWIVIFLFLFMTCLSVTQMDIDKLKPILSSGISPVLEGAYSSFSFPIGETVIFTMVFTNIAKGKSYTKTFLLGLIIGGFLIFVSILRNILVLGPYLLSLSYFPSHKTISMIHIGQLFQRLEIGVVIIYLICTYIKIAVCLMAVCKGISKVFGFDEHSFLATPIALLMLNLSFFIYKSTMEMVFWAFQVYNFYASFFQILIPFIIFIVVEIKYRLNKRSG